MKLKPQLALLFCVVIITGPNAQPNYRIEEQHQRKTATDEKFAVEDIANTTAIIPVMAHVIPKEEDGCNTEMEGAIAPGIILENSQINFEYGATIVSETAGNIDPAKPCRSYRDYLYRLKSGLPPSQAVTATLTLGGTAVKGRDYDITTNGSFASPSMNITFSTAGSESKTFLIRVYDDKSVGIQKTILLGFTLNNNGASIGNVYPTHTVTIRDNDQALMPASSGSVAIGSKYYVQPDEASCFGGYNLSKHRVQYLIRSTDINSAGLSGAAMLSSLAFDISYKISAGPFRGFTVSLAQVPASTTVLNSFVSAGFTQVYSGDYTTQAGTNTIPFSTNFNWDGSSNIVINICYDNGESNTYADFMWFSPEIGVGQFLTIASDGSGGAGCSLSAAYGYNNAPYVLFDYTKGAPVESMLSSSQSAHLGPYAEVDFKNTAGRIIASIKNLSDHDYGCTSIEIDRAGTSASPFWYADNENYLASKTFKVTTANPYPSGQYEIKLYYTKAEIDGWMAATGKKLNDPDVAIVKISNHQIKDVSPASRFPEDVVTAPPIKTNFGIDTVVTATFNGDLYGFGVGAPGASPLPVTLLAFTGKKNNDYVVLNWVTATEINNDHFDVETSKDGIHFLKIGEVKGNGNSNVQQRYSYIHSTPAAGTNYYRLNQVDIDGRSEYSKTLSVEFDQTDQTINIYPNPASDELHINFDNAHRKVVLKIVSIDGKIVAVKTMNNAQGKVSMNVSSLTSGLYVLEITMDNKEIKHFRFLKK